MPAGSFFRLFVLAYLTMRLAIEFIKPTYRPYLGLSAIQIACVVGIIACARRLLTQRTPTNSEVVTSG